MVIFTYHAPWSNDFGVETMEQPINIHVGKAATAFVCGKAIPWGSNSPDFVKYVAQGVLRPYNRSSVSLCHLELSNSSSSTSFGKVRGHPENVHPITIFGDGLILREPGQAVALVTRDCFTGVVENPQGTVGVFHGSRETLAHGDDGQTIACRTLKAMGHPLESRDARGWNAHLMAGICGHHFLHDAAHEQVGHYAIHGGPGATVTKGDQVGISLRHVVKHVLLERGFGERKITWDRHCTFSSERLGSKRRDQEGGAHNLIIVVKH